MNVRAGIQKQMDRMGIKSVCSLARRVSMNQPTLHRIMTEEVKDPRISTLLVLAKFFDVSVEELIGAE